MIQIKQRVRAILTNAGIDTHGIMRNIRQRIGKRRFDEADLIRDFFCAIRIEKGVMIDVGAHFGESFTPYLASGWTVYAFEPDSNPDKIDALSRLKHPRLNLFDLAVSEESGKLLPFYASEESTGISSLSAFTPHHKLVKEITTIALTDFISEKKIVSIDYLKIDTEGHELFALKGFPWKDIALHPTVILCEFEDRKTMSLGYGYQEIGNYLAQNGYAVFLSEWHPIVQYGSQHKWNSIRKFPANVESAESWGNFIAVKLDYLDVIKRMIESVE